MTVEIDGANNIVKTNTISEVTSANGVTVDGLNIKDSKLVTADSVIEANMSANSVDSDSYVDASIDAAHLRSNVITGQTALTSVANDDLVLLSDTSGSAALKKMTVANLVANVGGGKLKQVQFTNFDSNTTVSSTGSQTATYLTDQITPSASSSKIEVSMDFTWQINSTDADGRAQANWRIFRSINGGTYAGVYPENNNTNIALGYVDEDNILHQNHFVILFMDAPNTTNTVDYKLYIQLDEGDNMSVGQNVYSQISLKEYLQND